MRPNGRLPNGTVNGVLGTFFNRKAGDAVIYGGSADPLRVEACEHMAQTLPLLADQRLSAEGHIVKIQHELRFGDLQSGLAGLKKVSDSVKGNNDDNGGSDPKLKERAAAWDKFSRLLNERCTCSTETLPT